MRKAGTLRAGQLMSFDFTTGIFIFLVIFLLFAGVFGITRIIDNRKAFDLEMEYVFDNLENNLHSSATNPNQAFLEDYRIYSNKLSEFASYLEENPGIDFDSYTVGEVGSGHGIGLSAEGYDTCFYLEDEVGKIEPLAGLSALGRVYDYDTKNYVTCDSKLDSGKNPCEGYKEVMALFAPVLYDTGNTNDNRIVQMNLVVCKR